MKEKYNINLKTSVEDLKEDQFIIVSDDKEIDVNTNEINDKLKQIYNL